MNIPNILTLSRIGLAALLLLLLNVSFPLTKSLALIVFIVAGVTDYLDGQLARMVYGVTPFGQLMDPLADKILVCVAFISFVELQILPAWIVVVIISREFLVTGLRLLASTRGMVIAAGRWGKHKTVWQIVAIAVLLLGLAVRSDILRNAGEQTLENFDFAFHWISLGIGVAITIITVASGAVYFVENRELVSRM